MNVIGYTESGLIRAVFDGEQGESFVPDDMGNRHRQMIAEWEAEENTIPPFVPSPPIEAPAVPALCCIANLNVSGFDITGIDTATGMSTAFMLDVGVAWVFFAKPMANLNYSWNVNSSIGRANVTARAAEYIEIAITDNNGNPVENTELSVQIFKVQ